MGAIGSHIIDNMIPSDADGRAPRQEFEVMDIIHAAAKGSDLSVHLSEMPIFFWIFIIALVSGIVYVAEALVSVWVDEIVFHCGFVAYLMLTAVALITWP